MRLLSAVLALVSVMGLNQLFGQTRAVTADRNPKASEFSGLDVLHILDIPAGKIEVRLSKPYRRAKVAVVIGRMQGGSIMEEECPASIVLGLNPPYTKVSAGLVVLSEKRKFKVLLEGVMTDREMPEDFQYNYPTLNPMGFYDNGLVIFAYEPKDRSKSASRKSDCNRYLGLRLYLSE